MEAMRQWLIEHLEHVHGRNVHTTPIDDYPLFPYPFADLKSLHDLLHQLQAEETHEPQVQEQVDGEAVS